jgi:GNAT superfamily N-acetyltransferase
MDIECREIVVASPLFAGELALRDAVLRAPLGRESSATTIERDRTGRHFVALSGEMVIGCVGLYPEGSGVAVLRHLAVTEDMRRQGVARRLVAFAEERIGVDGVTFIEAEARVEAIPFYEAAGYATTGEIYVKHGVPHRLVSKPLRPTHVPPAPV